MKTRIIISAIALFSLVFVGNAQTTSETTTQNSTQQFVDANNDGVCDNFENRPENGRGMAYRKGNGNGNRNGQCYRQGNRYGNRNGNNKAFRRGNGRGNNKGFMRGNRRGNGQGRGQGQFVDADNNGVCDNRE